LGRLFECLFLHQQEAVRSSHGSANKFAATYRIHSPNRSQERHHSWLDFDNVMTSLREILGIDLPIIQAPMAGAATPQMVIAVSEAGGLGSLPCALYSSDQARQALDTVRRATSKPINLNFFCHVPPPPDPSRARAWLARLAPYYLEQGLDPEAPVPAGGRMPFDADFCGLVEDCRPEVVSFLFGLPERALFDRVKATGAKVIASATTVAEARWLEEHGCDAVIAMGLEAGGHRGIHTRRARSGPDGPSRQGHRWCRLPIKGSGHRCCICRLPGRGGDRTRHRLSPQSNCLEALRR
jgi:hypothetical protein